MAVPLNVSPCKVTGRFLRVVRDGSDTNRDPDGEPAAGLQIEIRATLSTVRNLNVEPPSWLSLEPIIVYTGSDGRMVGFSDDEDGVMVVASNGPGISPSNTWYYVATITGPGWPTQRIAFVAPANGTFDLVRDSGIPLDLDAAVDQLEAFKAQLQAKIDAYRAQGAPAFLG